jgi:hypothetical protein
MVETEILLSSSSLSSPSLLLARLLARDCLWDLGFGVGRVLGAGLPKLAGSLRFTRLGRAVGLLGSWS